MTDNRNRIAIYAIYDSAADLYQLLVANPTNQVELLRSYKRFLASPEAQYSYLVLHHQDFWIYQVAWFYPEDGTHDSIPRKLVARISELLPSTANVDARQLPIPTNVDPNPDRHNP